MKRDVVSIDPDRCTGCGRCVEACSEGAIGIVDGKAAVLDENVCDGLGACLPACPAGAISIVKADETADALPIAPLGAQWPVQIRLVPASAPFLKGCDLLLAADCSAFVHRSFHSTFAEGKAVLIGCPKLDPRDCWEKLSEIVSGNDVKSVTVVRMEVPCCSPLERAASAAVSSCKRKVPLRTVVLRKDGSVVHGAPSDPFMVQVR